MERHLRVLADETILQIRSDGGDMLKVRLAGGGGYGDPRSRPPEALLEDVIHEKVSPAGAARDYGVAVRGTPPRIDADETLLLRKGGRT